MQFDDYRDKRRNLKPIYAPARMSDRNIESNVVNSDICQRSIETNSLDVCHVFVFIKKMLSVDAIDCLYQEKSRL